MPHEKEYLKRTNILDLVLIGLVALLTAFITLLFLQYKTVEGLQDQNAQLQDALSELQKENNFYKKAYELTLDDIRVLSGYYGGDEVYDKLASELRKNELEIVLDGVSNNTEFVIENPEIWLEYQKKDVIRVDCLGEPLAVDTVQEEVLMKLSATSKEGLAIYANGNYLTKLPPGDVDFAATFVLSKGDHEIDLVSPAGIATVHTLSFDTVDLSPNEFTIDEGTSWEVFDCSFVKRGDTLTEPGAFRIYIYKS